MTEVSFERGVFEFLFDTTHVQIEWLGPKLWPMKKNAGFVNMGGIGHHRENRIHTYLKLSRFTFELARI